MPFKVLVEPSVTSRTAIKTLAHQVKQGLKASRLRFDEIEVKASYILVSTSDEVEVSELIARSPGVSCSGVVEATSPRFEEVVNLVYEVAKKMVYPDESFKVSVSQDGSFDYKPRDIEVMASSKLLEGLASKAVRVDEERPVKTIHVKVTKDAAYVFYHRVEGIGGLPIGSQGKAVSIVSSDVRSGIASFLSLRGGLLIYPILYDFRPIIQHSYIQRVISLVLNLKESIPHKGLKLAVVKSSELTKLKARCPARVLPIILRRMMVRAACLYAEGLGIKMVVGYENLLKEPTWAIDVLIEQASSLDKNLVLPILALKDDEVRVYAEKLGLRGESCEILEPRQGRPLNRIKDIEEKLGVDDIVKEGLKKIYVKKLDKTDLHQLLDELR